MLFTLLQLSGEMGPGGDLKIDPALVCWLGMLSGVVGVAFLLQ